MENQQVAITSQSCAIVCTHRGKNETFLLSEHGKANNYYQTTLVVGVSELVIDLCNRCYLWTRWEMEKKVLRKRHTRVFVGFEPKDDLLYVVLFFLGKVWGIEFWKLAAEVT